MSYTLKPSTKRRKTHSDAKRPRRECSIERVPSGAEVHYPSWAGVMTSGELYDRFTRRCVCEVWTVRPAQSAGPARG